MRALNTARTHLEYDGYELEPGHSGVVVVEGDDGVSRIERRGARTIFFCNSDEQTLWRLRPSW